MIEKVSEDNPWSEYRRLILKNLESLDDQVKELDKKVYSNMEEVYIVINDGERRTNNKIAELDKTLCADIANNTTDIAKLVVKAGFIGAIGGVLAGGVIQVLIQLTKH